jgi:organic radical activating enzyme
MKTIAIGYSSKCNIYCSHCICRPISKKNVYEKIGLKEAKFLILQAKAKNISSICFTIGEPFLFYNDIKILIKLCNLKNIKTSIVTNAFWAKNLTTCNRITQELCTNGLKLLVLSYSRFHKKFIPIKNIINAAKCCKDNNLKYIVSFCGNGTNEDTKIKTELESNNLFLKAEGISYFGNAKNINKTKNFVIHKCISTIPVVMSDSKVIGCCGAGVYFTKTNFFNIGNLNKENLSSVLENLKNNKLYQLIKTTNLVKLAKDINLKYDKNILSWHPCHLCEKIFNSKENIEKLKKVYKIN